MYGSRYEREGRSELGEKEKSILAFCPVYRHYSDRMTIFVRMNFYIQGHLGRMRDRDPIRQRRLEIDGHVRGKGCIVHNPYHELYQTCEAWTIVKLRREKRFAGFPKACRGGEGD